MKEKFVVAIEGPELTDRQRLEITEEIDLRVTRILVEAAGIRGSNHEMEITWSRERLDEPEDDPLESHARSTLAELEHRLRMTRADLSELREDAPAIMSRIRALEEHTNGLSKSLGELERKVETGRTEFACPPHGALFAGHRDEYPYCLLCEIARLNDRLAQFGGSDA